MSTFCILPFASLGLMYNRSFIREVNIMLYPYGFQAFSTPSTTELTSGGFKAKAFQKAEKVLRGQMFEKPHYNSRLS